MTISTSMPGQPPCSGAKSTGCWIPHEPEKNVTEVQVILHEWDRLFAEGAEKVLGAEASQHLMQGIESITPEIILH